MSSTRTLRKLLADWMASSLSRSSQAVWWFPVFPIPIPGRSLFFRYDVDAEEKNAVAFLRVCGECSLTDNTSPMVCHRAVRYWLRRFRAAA
jgi:hypothetical protein